MTRFLRSKYPIVLAFALASFLLITGMCFGQYETPSYWTYDESQTRLRVLPFAFYSRDTGAAGGAAVKYRSGVPYSSRFFSLGFTGYYTQHDQYSIKIKPKLSLGAGDFILSADIAYEYLSHQYFGIGNDMTAGPDDRYSSRHFDTRLVLQRRLSDSLYLGPAYRIIVDRITAVEGTKLPADDALAPGTGAVASALGFRATWDTRDDIYYPTEGIHAELETLAYAPLLGSDHSLTGVTADVCLYQSVTGRHVLALRGFFGAYAGDSAPFYLMYALGDTLRGFGENLFVDENVLTLQAEYRMPLFWRFGAVGFAGAGQVSESVGGFAFDRFRPSAGVGLRIAVSDDGGTILRIDYGVSEEANTLDFGIREAF